MNYEKIIIELLGRIQALEEKVGISSEKEIEDFSENMRNVRKKGKLSTAEIKTHIEEYLKKEKNEGKEFAEIICGVLHKQLNLKNAVPMVCNAMKACMKPGDAVVFRSPSGFSATLKIRYNLAEPDQTYGAKIVPSPDMAKGLGVAAPTTPLPGIGMRAGRGISGAPLNSEIEISATTISELSRAAIANRDAVGGLVSATSPLDTKPDTRPEIKPDFRQEASAKHDLSPVAVWRKILDNEWAVFYLPDGGEFAYIAGNDYLAIVRTNYRLPRGDIEKALALYPFKNTVALQHLRYPSYIYAILTDERIVGPPCK